MKKFLFYTRTNEAVQPSSSLLFKSRSSFKHFSFLMLLILSFCLSPTIHAQTAPPIQWQKSLGGGDYDQANSIQQTTDGAFIVAGNSESNNGDVSGNHGGADYWIVKLDANGNLIRQKPLGGSGSDLAYSIQQTTDGGFIIAGYSNSNDGDVSGNHGGTDDYWIVKLDANGNLVWQKSLGGSGLDYAYSIQQTTDGGFIVAGSSMSNDGDVSGNHGDSDDYWIVKLDANGNLVWQKSLGGSSSDQPYSIQQTSDGGFIVAGSSLSNDGDVSGNHGYDDCWIVKLDANGNLVWQKSLGGSNDDGAISIQQTTDGGFIVAGQTYSNDGDVSGNHGSSDCWIVKLDANGNIVWQKSLGGSSWDASTSVQETTGGGFIVAGISQSNDGDVSGNHGYYDDWIVKLDANGNLVWQKSLGGSILDWANFIQQTTDSGYIVAGQSNSNDGDVSGNHGGEDYWIVKLSAEIQSCLNPANLSVTNITATSAQLNWSIEGAAENFLVSYKTQNRPIQIKRMSGTASSVTLSNLTPNTDYQWSVIASCSTELTSSPAWGKRFKTASNNEEKAANISTIESLKIYPNPTSGSFILDITIGDEENAKADIEVLNQLGQIVLAENGKIDGGKLVKEMKLDAEPGMYLVRVIVGDRVFSKQISLQE